MNKSEIARMIFAKSSIFTAWSVTVGGIAALISLCFVKNSEIVSVCFMFGACLPIGPLTWYLSSVSSLRKNIEKWQRLKEDKIITAAHFHNLRETAIEWYKQKWFSVSTSIPDVVKSESKDSD